MVGPPVVEAVPAELPPPGWKGYTTNLVGQSAEFVIDAYHQLWRIERSFRMSKHDLQARPIYHHTRESIEAHLSIVFAALAVSHWIEHQTGWSIKKFVRTARRYRTVTIQAGRQMLRVGSRCHLGDGWRPRCHGGQSRSKLHGHQCAATECSSPGNVQINDSPPAVADEGFGSGAYPGPYPVPFDEGSR